MRRACIADAPCVLLRRLCIYDKRVCMYDRRAVEWGMVCECVSCSGLSCPRVFGSRFLRPDVRTPLPNVRAQRPNVRAPRPYGVQS